MSDVQNVDPQKYVDGVSVKKVQETQAALLTQIGEFKEVIDKAEKKYNGEEVNELKTKVNNMVNDMSTSVNKNEKLWDDAQKRIQELDDEVKLLRGQKLNWQTSGPGTMEDAFMTVYHDLRKAGDVEDFGGATQAILERAVKNFGFQGQKAYDGFDFRSLMFPDRYKNAITSLGGPDIAAADGQAGALLTPQYIERPLEPAQEQNTISDAFPVFNMMGEKVIWREERLSVRAAYREASSTTGRPKSRQALDFTGTGQGNVGGVMTMAWDQRNVESRTFLATAQASVQIISDAPYVREQVQEQLQYEQERTVDRDILYGSNTSGAQGVAEFSGLNHAAVTFTPSLLSDIRSSRTQLVDVLRTSWLQGVLTYISPDRHFLHPTDYTAISLLKDNDGDYLFPSMKEDSTTGNKTGPMGMPVLCSTYVNKDTWFTVPTKRCRLGVKKGWTADVSMENKDNFETLQVTFRVYGRYAFIQFRPNSTVKGKFSDALR